MKLLIRDPHFNTNLEWHAMKIYNPKMMEVIREGIYESGFYSVECIMTNMKYRLTHVHAGKGEAWARVKLDVRIEDGRRKHTCYCGKIEHMGLLCRHVIKLMVHLDVLEIPQIHIMKRWMRDARDVLPPHLRYYQRDSSAVKSQTFCHCTALIGASVTGGLHAARYEEFIKIVTEAKS